MRILIIAKVEKFSKELSTNRYHFLKYLSLKSNNIIVVEESKCNISLIRNINPSIIIYYWLTIHKDYGKMLIPNFSTINIKKVLLVEDLYHIKDILSFYKKYNFNNMIIHYKQNNFKKYFEKYIHNTVYELPQTIDNKIFRDYNQNKKIDILLYGCCIPKYYPFRARIVKILEKVSSKHRILILKSESTDIQKNKNPIIGEKLSRYINMSYLTVCTPMSYDIYVKKYKETILSKSVILGPIPTDYKDEFDDNYINIEMKMSDNEIIKIIDNALKDKQKLNNIAEINYKKYSNLYNFETGYDNFIKVLDCLDHVSLNFSH